MHQDWRPDVSGFLIGNAVTEAGNECEANVLPIREGAPARGVGVDNGEQAICQKYREPWLQRAGEKVLQNAAEYQFFGRRDD